MNEYGRKLVEQEEKFNANLQETDTIKKQIAKLQGDLDQEKLQKEQLQTDLNTRTEENVMLSGKLLKSQETIRALVSNLENVSQTINVKKRYDEIYNKIKERRDENLITQEDYENKLKPILDEYYGVLNNIAETVLKEYSSENISSSGGDQFGGEIADSSLSVVLGDPEKLSISDKKFTPGVLNNIGLHQKTLTNVLRELEEQRQIDTVEQIKKEHKQQLKDEKEEENVKSDTELET